jgi:hypothetical protein
MKAIKVQHADGAIAIGKFIKDTFKGKFLSAANREGTTPGRKHFTRPGVTFTVPAGIILSDTWTILN